MKTRRSIVGMLLGLVGLASAQKVAVQNGKAIVCQGDKLTCPNGHETCASIDAPIIVGSDRNRDYPEWAPLYQFHMERCEQCHVLFTRE